MKRKTILLALTLLISGLVGCAASATNEYESHDNSNIVADTASTYEDSETNDLSDLKKEKLSPGDIDIFTYKATNDMSTACSIDVAFKFNKKQGLQTPEDILDNYDFILNAYYQGTDHLADRISTQQLVRFPGVMNISFIFDNSLDPRGFLINLKIVDKEDGTVIYEEEPKYLEGDDYLTSTQVFFKSWASAFETGTIENYGEDIEFEVITTNLAQREDLDYNMVTSAKIKNKTNLPYKIPNLNILTSTTVRFTLTPEVDILQPNEEREILFKSIEKTIPEINPRANEVIYTLTDENNYFGFTTRNSEFFEQLKNFSVRVY